MAISVIVNTEFNVILFSKYWTFTCIINITIMYHTFINADFPYSTI